MLFIKRDSQTTVLDRKTCCCKFAHRYIFPGHVRKQVLSIAIFR